MTRIPCLASVIGGRYELIALAGEGGMAQVWEARHLALGMPVAVKLLHPRMIAKQSSRERFLTEAKVMAALQTRHAIRVFDFGITPDGQPYLVMELVDGETLGQRLSREGTLSPAAACKILSQAARGLERAHALGIVHRDFKPDNVMLARDEDGELCAKVGDFGVAKLSSSSRWELPREAPPNEFAGTPVYMSPEQLVHGREATAASDVWSFGVVAYEVMTGKMPFRARDLHALGRRVAAGEHRPPSSRRRSLPRAFDSWFARACHVDPAERFPSIGEAARALAASLGQLSAARPRHHRTVIVAALTAVCAGPVAWGLGSRARPTVAVSVVRPAEVAPVAHPPPLQGAGPMMEPRPEPPRRVVPPRMVVQQASLPTYRALPDDEPARGFKADPY